MKKIEDFNTAYLSVCQQLLCNFCLSVLFRTYASGCAGKLRLKDRTWVHVRAAAHTDAGRHQQLHVIL